MRRLGVMLAVTLSLHFAAEARAQPTPPAPIKPPAAGPTYPQMLQTPPPAAGGPVETEPLVVVETPVTAPALRVPASFSALYNSSFSTPYYAPANRPNMNPYQCGSPGCDACAPCAVCGPCGRIWGDVEYIYWRARADHLPPIVTTSPPGTPPNQAGVLGLPGTREVLGGPVGDDWRHGLRGALGVWFNEAQTVGVQVGAFVVSDVDATARVESIGSPILARPFTSALTGAPLSQLIAVPGLLGGSLGLNHSSSVNGFDAAFRGNLCCGQCYRIDALLGYRSLRLDDDLAISETLTTGPSSPALLGVPAGASVTSRDRFTTTNAFNGIQLGVAGEVRFLTVLFVSGSAKASLGWLDQGIDITGDTLATIPGQAPVQNIGGLYALSSNIGHFERTDAVIIPEATLNLGVQISRNLRLKAGYNFLYCNSVIRPGTVIDTTINPALIPPATATTPARPAVRTDATEYYLHGLNAGLELRF